MGRRLTIDGDRGGGVLIGFKVPVWELVGVVQTQRVADLMKQQRLEMVAATAGESRIHVVAGFRVENQVGAGDGVSRIDLPASPKRVVEKVPE